MPTLQIIRAPLLPRDIDGYPAFTGFDNDANMVSLF